MLRKPLAVAAAGVALATPSAAFAMHGPGEQSARVPKNLESRGSLAAGVLAAASTPGGFSWVDAGIGASVTAGGVLVLVGGRRVITQRHGRVRLDHAS
jgi:hypothetical protein